MRIIQPERASYSLYKQPPVSYLERINNTPFLDKLQVITGDGEPLPKSYYYEKYKDIANAYKTFYAIPEKLSDIKIAKKEEDKSRKEPQVIPGINADRKDLLEIEDKKVVQFKPIIKSVEPQISLYKLIQEDKFDIYKGPKQEVQGKKIDFYI